MPKNTNKFSVYLYHRMKQLAKMCLFFSGTNDNERSVALGVEKVLNFSGAIRCICHTVSLVVNDAVDQVPYLQSVLEIGTYLSNHKKAR